ncbi:hypothetical protein FTV88_2835 [Heliorestis convoluta]|uniref:Uncharacterized protein n=1 Tax=Heliorestis convoluta TaxID=356322 RepID=A0A5Q2N0R8_9FIRM|nr:hypothetical protein FTV88_2835 [Heliorestis convoluta]
MVKKPQGKAEPVNEKEVRGRKKSGSNKKKALEEAGPSVFYEALPLPPAKIDHMEPLWQDFYRHVRRALSLPSAPLTKGGESR